MLAVAVAGHLPTSMAAQAVLVAQVAVALGALTRMGMEQTELPTEAAVVVAARGPMTVWAAVLGVLALSSSVRFRRLLPQPGHQL